MSATASSEGFDLDAIPASTDENGSDVIYELGGGATAIDISPPPTEPKAAQDPPKDPSPPAIPATPSPTQRSEDFKAKGNEQFKQGNYLDAIDYYTDAIEACPGMTGDEILQLQANHEESEREKATQRYDRDSERRLARDKKKLSSENDNKDKEHNDKDEIDEDEDDDLAPTEFEPPIHPHGKQLAIYYSNRAACLIALQKYNDAITDCDVATLVSPTYVKAYTRRMTCYEQTDKIENALKDAKKAKELNPTNREIQKHVMRLQKLEDERMEKLKEETMGKLKDLGNSILGNFGMSLDNFNAVKDPNTGSYSISFNK